MENLKNILMMEIYYLKVNILTGKEMEKENYIEKIKQFYIKVNF